MILRGEEVRHVVRHGGPGEVLGLDALLGRRTIERHWTGLSLGVELPEQVIDDDVQVDVGETSGIAVSVGSTDLTKGFNLQIFPSEKYLQEDC